MVNHAVETARETCVEMSTIYSVLSLKKCDIHLFLPSSLTGWPDECVKKLSRSSPSPLIHNFYRGKKVTRKFELLTQQKTAQSKLLPNGQKLAQSGHPVHWQEKDWQLSNRPRLHLNGFFLVKALQIKNRRQKKVPHFANSQCHAKFWA
jgi:hypothetical protein